MDKYKLNIKNKMDVIVGFCVIGIILMIIVPLPAFMLDILLALNIAFSLLILLLTLFSTSILQLSAFPTLLLVSTLFRLGLNISSTRLILGDGYAGNVIESFGSFVVRGNYVVGLIIFLIIVLVQFIVITNGSSRVSEVSARFSLDSLPGKQMSIDADLNAGIINEKMAKKRRLELQQEMDFYGAMDGASKFVKGDAIAGIVVTCINIIGGIIIGMIMLDMEFMQAIQTYIRLTIGDGLVSQIPALLISTSAGILVTKANGDGDTNFGTMLGSQLTSVPVALMMTGAVLTVLGLLPGLPKLAFFTLGASLIISGYFLKKDADKEAAKIPDAEELEIEPIQGPEDISSLLDIEPLEVEIGYGLIPLADEKNGGDLLQRISSIRRQCALDMGILVQPIRIRDNIKLNTNQYTIKIRGIVADTYELMPNMVMCMDSMGIGFDEIQGIKTTEPSFGLEALWIKKELIEEAELLGYTIVDPSTILVTHLLEVIKLKAHELVGREEVKAILDITKEKYGVVVDELIPDLMSLGEVQKVLQNLLKEKVSIKDRVTILETLADNAKQTKDLELLTEYVRIALSKNICQELVDESNSISVVTLSKNLEDLINSSLQRSASGTYPALNPEYTNVLFTNIQELKTLKELRGEQLTILVSPKIRMPFRKLIEMIFPDITVLSLNEIPSNIRIKSNDVIDL